MLSKAVFLRWQCRSSKCRHCAIKPNRIQGLCIFFQACRPVLCPEGEMRIKGVCRVVGLRWYVQNVQLYIKLTPVNPALNLSHLNEITDEQLASPKKEFLSSPRLQDWDTELFYRTHDNETTIEYILAVLFLRTQILQPEMLMKNIERSFQQNWKFYTTNNMFDLRAEFNSFISYSRYLDGKETRYAPHSKHKTHIFRGDSVIHWSVGTTWSTFYMTDRLCITKLFFCEQITFQSDEFEFIGAKIYLTPLNKSLGNAELIPILNLEGRYQEVQVCMLDVIAEINGALRKLGHGLFVYLAICLCSKNFISAYI